MTENEYIEYYENLQEWKLQQYFKALENSRFKEEV